MFVADTSVWIDSFRGRFAREAVLLRRTIEEKGGVCICGPILQEILQGFRNDSDFRAQLERLLEFSYLETTRWTFLRAASLYRGLRRRGVTANSFDTTIAAVCLENGLPLLTCNRRDFEPIARYAGLTLA